MLTEQLNTNMVKIFSATLTAPLMLAVRKACKPAFYPYDQNLLMVADLKACRSALNPYDYHQLFCQSHIFSHVDC
jgi:hypothetical protein